MKRWLALACLFAANTAVADGSVPISFTVYDDVDAENTFEVYGPSLGLGPNDTLQLVDVVELAPDRDGYRFQQYHQGLKVLSAKIGVHAREGKASSVVGRIVPSLNLRLTTPRPERDARTVAVRKTRARAFAPVQRPAELVITYPPSDRTGSDPRVAWRFFLEATDPFGPHVIDVDAYDLSVITHFEPRRGAYLSATIAQSLLAQLPPDNGTWTAADGTGTALYEGPVELDVEAANSPAGNQYRLRRQGNAPVFTFDLGLNQNFSIAPGEFLIDGASCPGGFEDCVGTTCTGRFEVGNCNNLALAAAVNAHHAGIATMDFFENVFGHAGVNGAGAPAVLLINQSNVPGSTPTFANAFQHMQQINNNMFTASFFANGQNGSLTWSHVVPLDVVAHEITHAVVDLEVGGPVGLVPSGESGALAESLSDIFALAIENHVYGGFDWKFGEKVFNPQCWRDIGNPLAGCSLSPLPNVFGGTNWVSLNQTCDSTNDFCGVHANSAVASRWYYHLVNGCQAPLCTTSPQIPMPYGVDAIDALNALQILRNAIPILSPNATFADLRAATITEAIELFGPNTPQHISVTNAWHAVGVGPRYLEPPTNPVDGQTNVEPWKAELQWELGPGYGAHPCPGQFEVLISRTPDMADSRPAEQIEIFEVNGVPMGRAIAALLPNTLYYWKIFDPDRNTCQPAHERAVHDFTTAQKMTVPLSPTRSSPCQAFDKNYTNGECHPWQLVFTWQATPGAERYFVEVSDDPSFVPLVEQWDIEDTMHKANVLVEKHHYWQIKPRGPTTIFDEVENDGIFTDNEFDTTLPSTDIYSPLEPVPYPWPVRHEWAPVVGVGYYNFYLHAPNAVYQPYEAKELHVPFLERYLPGRESWLITFEWSVHIFGPELPMLGNMREEGEPMLGKQYDIDGSVLVPEITEPLLGQTQACIPYDSDINIRWETIEGALFYKLSLTERRCDANNNCGDGAVIYNENILQEESYSEQHVIIPNANQLLEDDVYGWTIHLRAVAPDDVFADETFSVVNLRPPTPLLHLPANNATRLLDINDPQVELTWDGGWSHKGLFSINLYYDPACIIGPNEATSQPGNQSAIYFSGLGEGDELEIGWKVGAAVVSGSGCQTQWSECRKLKIIGHEENEDPPPPEDSIACGEGMNYGQGDTLDDGFAVDVGGDPGWVWIAIDTLTIPDALTFTYGNQLIYNSGCMGAAIGSYFWLDGSHNTIQVTADANCDPSYMGNTKWGFAVSCANEGGIFPVVGTE